MEKEEELLREIKLVSYLIEMIESDHKGFVIAKDYHAEVLEERRFGSYNINTGSAISDPRIVDPILETLKEIEERFRKELKELL